MNTFEINGMMATMMMAGGFMDIGGYQRKGPRVNIITEYELIQNKKSKLSRWEREYVVSAFERNFIKVTKE